MRTNLKIYTIDVSTSLPLKYVDKGIRAGFPSLAQDYLEHTIDLNKETVKHLASTFYGRVEGDSMKDEGIEDGNILVIDKSLELIGLPLFLKLSLNITEILSILFLFHL